MADGPDPENTLIITLKNGDVTIELLPDVAPKHVERVKALARAGEYDNVAFHRVIDGFMAQTGDVANGDMEDGFNIRRAGTGGSIASRPAGGILEAALRSRRGRHGAQPEPEQCQQPVLPDVR